MFKEIQFKDVQEKIYTDLQKEGALLLVGDMKHHNTMTIGWATAGILWSQEVLIVYVKPTRYTYQLIEKCSEFSVCYFDNQDKNEILRYCGTHSGKDVNKDEEMNLTPILINNHLAYEQAKVVVTCQKIYQDDFKGDNFLDKDVIKKRYGDGKYHSFYIGKVVGVYCK